MAQLISPIADLAGTESTGATVGRGWTDPSYTLIDESTPSDSDYTSSPLVPTTSEYLQVRLAAASDPGVTSSHVVSYRYRKNLSGGAQMNLQVGLYQGGSTLIASSAVHTDVSDTWVTGSFILTDAEAGSITDYSDLSVRLVAEQIGT